MRADKDVDLAVLNLLNDHLLLLRRTEARDHFDVDGELRKAALEGLKVLEAEDRGGRENSNLLPVLHGLECGAHGNFRLSVAHVSAEQAVHGLRRFHVVLDGAYGGELIVGLGVVEGLFELVLKLVVLGEGIALDRLALGIKLQQFGGHVLHRLADARLGLGPLL